MTVRAWRDEDTTQAQQWWAVYQQTHDLTARRGQTAGIDPVQGRVWFGDSAQAIATQVATEGVSTPLYFVRVGSDYYLRKGGRQ
jgi:hypothetical protein